MEKSCQNCGEFKRCKLSKEQPCENWIWKIGSVLFPIVLVLIFCGIIVALVVLSIIRVLGGF